METRADHLGERPETSLAILPDGLTLLFEIIYPENREGRALRYADREGLFIIGARRLDGADLGYDEL